MFEKFESDGILDKIENVEKLEPGVYLEYICSESEVFEEDESEDGGLAFGDFGLQDTWWRDCMVEARETGFADVNGNMTCKEIMDFLEQQECFVELEKDLSLEDLISKLANGEKVVCLLNNFVLEVPAVYEMPSIKENAIFWLKGIDLSDQGNERVVLEGSGVPADAIPVDGVLADGVPADGTYPLEHFLKAWKVGGNRAFSIIPKEV